MKIVSTKQSGQAVIEYILVLLVVVSIIMGVMWQFSQGFRKFTDSYFGDYLACLLELGELPGLGGTSSGQCTYEPIQMPKGTTPNTAGGSGKDDKKDKSDGAKPGGGKGSYVSGAGSGGGSSAHDSNGQLGGAFSPNSREGRPSSVVIGTAKTDTYTGSTEASSGSGKGDAANKKSISVEYVDQSGGVIDPFEQRKEKEVAVGIAKDSQHDNLKSKKTKVDITRKLASANQKTEDTKMTFGDFLRWLLIAAIILGVVVFVGGQVLQVSKSWE